MPQWLRWLARPPPVEHLHLNREDKRRLVYSILDLNPFPWRTVFASGISLLTYSYNIAALNFILPILSWLYWPGNTAKDLLLKELSLVGLVTGQVLLGYLADRYGRKRMGGLYLVITIFSILGFVQSSSGNENSMSVLGWLCTWRILLSFGIGAQYPLSSVITAELAPTRSRARALAAVFLMEPVGLLMAAVVTFAVSTSFETPNATSEARTLDQIWRIIVGVGAFPALIAIIFQLTIPESPRFTMDVLSEVDKAYNSVQADDGDLHSALSMSIARMIGSDDPEEVYLDSVSERFEPLRMKRYFLYQGNWRHMAGVTACWFLLDLAYYSLDGYSSTTVSMIWSTSVDERQPLQALQIFSWHSMIVVSIGSVLGVLLAAFLVDYTHRLNTLVWTFVCLAVVFVVAGATLFQYPGFVSERVTIVLFALCYFISNLGPNTLLFMLSAELFPTRYRATAFGVSTSLGNLAQIIIQVIIYGSNGHRSQNIHWRSGLIFCSTALLLLGALLALAWLPQVQVQKPRDREQTRFGYRFKYLNMTLEELAQGRTRAQQNGEVIGLRQNIRRIAPLSKFSRRR